MADSPACSVYKKESVVRGHHIYKTSWTTVIGEELTVKREENKHNEHAVAVKKNGAMSATCHILSQECLGFF